MASVPWAPMLTRAQLANVPAAICDTAALMVTAINHPDSILGTASGRFSCICSVATGTETAGNVYSNAVNMLPVADAPPNACRRPAMQQVLGGCQRAEKMDYRCAATLKEPLIWRGLQARGQDRLGVPDWRTSTFSGSANSRPHIAHAIPHHAIRAYSYRSSLGQMGGVASVGLRGAAIGGLKRGAGAGPVRGE